MQKTAFMQCQGQRLITVGVIKHELHISKAVQRKWGGAAALRVRLQNKRITAVCAGGRRELWGAAGAEQCKKDEKVRGYTS